MLGGKGLVDVDSETRRFARMHHAFAESVGMGKHGVGFRRVAHVLLHAEVGHGKIEVQGGRHAHRRKIGGAVAAGPHMVQVGQRGLIVENKRRLMCLSMFWHFLDVVWIGVFSFVYLMGVLG